MQNCIVICFMVWLLWSFEIDSDYRLLKKRKVQIRPESAQNFNLGCHGNQAIYQKIGLIIESSYL